MLMDVLPEKVRDWAPMLSGGTHLWQQGQLTPGQLAESGGHLVLLAEQLEKSALHHSLKILDEEGVIVEVSGVKLVAERDLLSLRLSAWSPALKARLQAVADGWDLACVPALPQADTMGLVLMDMDSTAIQMECIDEIALLAGVGEEVAAVTRAAMEGALPFSESLRRRVKALSGADAAIIEQVIARMPLMPGLITLVEGLKAMGWKVALASGGFTPFTGHLQQTLGLDAAFANTLEIRDGRLTGEVLGDIVDAEAKARILVELAEQYDIPISQTVAIGDGANDLLMLAQAGLGVALHAKPLVQEKAPVCLNRLSLEGVLGLLQAR
ncbi:phosphoserine phosphatase SerB [Oceanisphaera psychrotolerans]|uniref:Phosphoserine phosphatase n=1 Tax=Oceanisphaera psychrotolerans TaxID=1414654 RepID=A0A1J4QIW3_9GAMM|nr:phosphoserine phosphatase SerB [Oceanisphaera psychrotolerans]OIN13569.1 phosphoserine phosphatase SerB [Oceanisphaera psychrotolerans]